MRFMEWTRWSWKAGPAPIRLMHLPQWAMRQSGSRRRAASNLRKALMSPNVSRCVIPSSTSICATGDEEPTIIGSTPGGSTAGCAGTPARKTASRQPFRDGLFIQYPCAPSAAAEEHPPRRRPAGHGGKRRPYGRNGYILSGSWMPSRPSPCFSVRAVSSHRARRECRTGPSDFRTGHAS